ncbi:protein-tyrosine phosphatase-like protein [Trametes polyzona]|nr:protein-tyrosine phosphatase-like protein [Trametes polyzona]
MPNVTIKVGVASQGETPVKSTSTQRPRSPPTADTLVSMLRSVTVDTEYFQRRNLHQICTQRSPTGPFRPQASQIVPRLYLCDLYTATSPYTLSHLGITHVVSVLPEPPTGYASTVQHLCVPVDDDKEENLLDYLDATVAWIRAALASGGSVLVHCVWGMSRSASVAVAYLIAARGMSLDDALALARSRRRVVRPNSGFMLQLRVYERVSRLREAVTTRVMADVEKSKARAQAKREAKETKLDVEDLTRRLGAIDVKA